MKIYSLILFLVLFLIEINTIGISAEEPALDIIITPSQVTLKIKKSFSGDMPDNHTITLHIRSLRSDVSIVDYYLDPFFEEQDRSPPLDINFFPFQATPMNLTSKHRVDLKIMLNLAGKLHPGIYTSKLYVISSSDSITDIPLKIIVSSSDMFIIVCLGFGVFLNLFLFLLSDYGEYRDALRDVVYSTDSSIEEVYYSISEAYDEGKGAHLDRAIREYTNLLWDWENAIVNWEPIFAFKNIVDNSKKVVGLVTESKNKESKEEFPLKVTLVETDKILSQIFNRIKNPNIKEIIKDYDAVLNNFRDLIYAWNHAIDRNGTQNNIENIEKRALRIRDNLELQFREYKATLESPEDFSLLERERDIDYDYLISLERAIDTDFSNRSTVDDRFKHTNLYQRRASVRQRLRSRYELESFMKDYSWEETLLEKIKYIIRRVIGFLDFPFFRGYLKEHILFFSLFITFAVVVINSWQTYLSQTIAFGASGIADIIAAILFGFGSQTVLTEGVGVAKKWAEYRSKPVTEK